MLEDLAGQGAKVLYRLNIIVVKSLGLLRHDHRAVLGLGPR
jgi:hypothetical protein